MATPLSDKPARRPHWREHLLGSGLMESYATRMLAALTLSLLVVIGVVHIPFGVDAERVGWWVLQETDTIPAESFVLQMKQESKVVTGAPITFFEATDPEEAAPEGEAEALAEEAPPPEIESAQPPIRPALAKLDARRTVLNFTDEMPSVEGGLGAYYIHIDYPRAAIDAGIEGRLVLEFVVERDGEPTNIRVLKSLHPLCDSAAVQALRRTEFVPGRQQGETVAVRMRLPVAFRLVDPGQRGASPDSTRRDSTITL